MEGIISEWDSSGMESSSSFGNIGRLYEMSGCFSQSSRSSGLLVTVPELIRNIAPMRYGLLAEEFYKSDGNSETIRSIEKEQIVPSSSLSKLFIDDDDEIRHIGCQYESFYMEEKFCIPQNSTKSSSDGKSYTLFSKLSNAEEGVSECHSKTEEVPISEPTLNMFCGTDKECTKNDSVFSGRKVHRTFFPSVLERGPVFNRKNRISTASLASYRYISGKSNFFDRFRYERIPRAAARRFLIDRDPKYKAKYG